MREWLMIITLALPAVAGSAFPLFGDDEADQEDAPPAQVEAFWIPEDMFDQMVFQEVGTIEKWRDSASSRLKICLGEIEATCGLSEPQRQKLELAGRLDIERMADRVEQERAKFNKIQDQGEFEKVFNDLQSMHRSLEQDLFTEDSLLCKTVGKVLDAESAAKYAKVLADRRAFHYQAMLKRAIMDIERRVPLLTKQRDHLLKLLIEETVSPRRCGEYGYWVTLYQLSTIPEEKSKPIFDDSQWRRLQFCLRQAKGLEQFLREQGCLPPAEAGPESKKAEEK